MNEQLEESEELLPAEFVRMRQEEHPATPPQERYFSDYLRQQLKEQPELAARLKEDSREDYALHIISRLKPRLSEPLVRVLETDAVAIGEINDPQPNAHCHPLGPGRFAITFNTGLKDFNYRVVRAFSTRFAPRGESHEEAVSFEDTCRIIGDIFLWLNEIGSSHGPGYPITKDQFVIANILTFEVNCFFLAHELAHGALHLSRSVEVEASDQNIDAEQEEYLADEFALRVLLNRPEGSSDLPAIEISYAAIELSLLIWQGLEQFGVEFEGTHPTGEARLTAIRRVLAEACPEPQTVRAVAAMAEPMRVVFERVLDEIRAPNYEAFLDRAANQLVSELDALLDRCTGGMVPDYMTFYQEANRFFAHGISLKLSQRMAIVARDWFEKMERVRSEHDKAEAREAWILFQKYKLFLGFIQELPSEVRAVFEKALGMAQSG